MAAVALVFREHLRNLYLIRRLSWFELKAETRKHYLGFFWEIFNPAVQICIYWFVFGVGIRASRTVEHVPYVLWISAGMVVWFFVNQAVLAASRSVFSRIRIVAKMNFPASIIPSYVIISKWYPHLVLTVLLLLWFSLRGYMPSLYLLQLPYFMFCLLLLLVAVSLITSTLSTVVRDVHMAVASLMRVLMYLTPVLWSPKGLGWLELAMKANPLYYVVEGYRAALFGDGWYFLQHARYTLYFWVVVAVLFLIGAVLHGKFRADLVDYA
ncbi:MAG: ABC transporter permease [Thermoflavifilum sp.]|nr:ABC transporter permease [Thermoflavifilum sp.]MCL6514452.1 ABC transporter permease [Alicyclobacillus sp.]